jgi:hypothetical protein
MDTSESVRLISRSLFSPVILWSLADTTQIYGHTGVSIAGHNDATVQGTQLAGSNYGGVLSLACTSLVPQGALLFNPLTTAQLSTQSNFVSSIYDFATCIGPGPIQSSL